MTRPARLIVLLVTAATSLLILTACGSDAAPVSARSFSGTIEGYAGPAASLRSIPYPEGYFGDVRLASQQETTTGTGEIDAAGRFTFRYDETVPNGTPYSSLLPANCDGAAPTVSDPDVLVYGSPPILAFDGEAAIGYIVKTDLPLVNNAAPRTAEGSYVIRIHADGPVSVEGTCASSSSSIGRFVYDLDLVAGWSVIHAVYDYDQSSDLITVTIRNGDSGAPWTFFDEEDPVIF